MSGWSPEWVQTVAALMTMLAAFAALVIAWRAPLAAARFAENMRADSAKDEELRRFRMAVFTSLMKHRSEILAPDARAAINLVDVAFANVPDVRSAHKLFLSATLDSQPEKIVERYHSLIEAVARNINFAEAISGFDVRSGYYPDAIGKIDAAAIAEAEEKIARRNAASSTKGSKNS